MESSIFTSKLLMKNTWVIMGRGASSYLLAGDKYGIVIDSGEAEDDIHAYAEKLTDKPVDLVFNTHGHFDHTGGNGYFKCAFMGEKAAEIAKLPNGNQDVKKYPLDYPIVVIEDGFRIDLGDRVVEAINIDGHSPDSLAFLDRKMRILFGGDSIQPVVPLKYKCVDPQPGVLNYVMNLSKIMQRRNEFDYLCGGHTTQILEGTVFDHIFMAALRALDGECDDEPERKERKDGPFKDHDRKNNGYIQYKEVSLMFDKRYVKCGTRHDIVLGT